MRNLISYLKYGAAACLTLVTVACGTPTGGEPVDESAADAITYRDDLSQHPGCSTAGLGYVPAQIPGYKCAAKEYAGTEDPSKPIVLLIHGNSDTPSSWERFPSDTGIDQLSERLAAAGFKTFAVDLRTDLVDDPQGNNETENAARNMDHGWGVPIAQHFIASVLDAHPDRQIAVVGFSFGTTVMRDALRRLYVNDGVDVFSRVDHVIALAGANHGVSSCALCDTNPTMRGRVTCEMGCRDGYSPTDFLRPLNGPTGMFETPCADGDTAFGATQACGGHSVQYLTVVMQDIEQGTYQDKFVSEASAALAGAANVRLALDDFDESGYFFDGLFKNHYGSCRSGAALDAILSQLGE